MQPCGFTLNLDKVFEDMDLFKRIGLEATVFDHLLEILSTNKEIFATINDNNDYLSILVRGAAEWSQKLSSNIELNQSSY